MAHGVPSYGYSEQYAPSLASGYAPGQLLPPGVSYGGTGPGPYEGPYGASPVPVSPLTHGAVAFHQPAVHTVQVPVAQHHPAAFQLVEGQHPSQAYAYGAEQYGAQAHYGTPIANAAPEYAPAVYNAPGYAPGYAPQSVSAAVVSSRQVAFREFINPQPLSDPTNVFIDAPVSPVNLVYRSSSSPVSVQNLHQSNPGVFKQTSSVDEPHHTVHTVHKPVIQELHEIISPIRKVQQQVLPVQEQVQTVVSKAVKPPVYLQAPVRQLEYQGAASLAHHPAQEHLLQHPPQALLHHQPGPVQFRQHLAGGPHRHHVSHGFVLGNGPLIKQGPLHLLQETIGNGPFRHIGEPAISEGFEEDLHQGHQHLRIPRHSYRKRAAAGAA